MLTNDCNMNGSRGGDCENEAEDKTIDMTASSSSEGSPSSAMPNLGDLSLEKDVDRKTLLQELYDLKLRIYYMEQREKLTKGEDGDDIYQKYIDVKKDFEKLSRTMDEKDDLLLKAQKVTTYLREEKEKQNYEFSEKEKFYKESIQQLEKELEEMKLCNPKFGLHSTMFMSGDTGDSFSVLSNKDQKRISELEHQIDSLNMELESLRANNGQLEQTVNALQRKINICSKEYTDLSNEVIRIQREKDLAVETSSKNCELLNTLEKEKEQLEVRLTNAEEELERMNKSADSTEKPSASEQNQPLSDKAAAVVIRQLLTENKQTNRQLRKLKEEQLLTYEMCSTCTHCQRERKLKKASVLNLRQKGSTVSTSEDDRSDTASQLTDSETEQNYENLSKFQENSEIRALLKDKDKQIKQLRAECKKRNYNLQGLVNKELWDKNREIEKLNKLCEKQKHEIELLRRQSDRTTTHPAMREIQPSLIRNYSIEGKENILSLSDDVKMLREQLRTCLEEKKSLLSKITHLETKINSDEEQKAQTSLVHNLRLEVAKHRDDFEEAEKARKDAFNACAMLTNRLEELATFLESMLGHENTGLNSKKRELLKQAIDRSRQISKTFSSTFADPDNASIVGTKFESSVDLSAPILPDYSEINLSFSCGDDDDDEDVVSHTLKQDDENSVFNRMMRRSHDFASTEDSDSYPVKKSVLFVNDLNASGELIFSSEGVRRIDDDTNEATDGSRPMQKCHVCCSKVPESLPTSIPVSANEAPKTADFDSGSESWSGPGRKVRYTLTNSGTKLRSRRMRPEPCYSTDSDASARIGKDFETNETRMMQRRILNLERINDSLRKDLKYLRSGSDRTSTVEKTDQDKLHEKTKLRNLLNKINLENCVDTDKYRVYVENVRRHLRELTKQLIKSKKFEKSFVLSKLNEVSKHFEMSELCCSRLFHYLEDSKTRCDVLTSLLEETQSKFEQVMVDLHTTKLAYNSVILEHEQNIFKYKQSEMANEQMNEKLKTVEEHCRTVELDLNQVRNQLLEREPESSNTCNCVELRKSLEKASLRISELETFVSTNDHTLEELNECKQTVQKLTDENEKLLSDLEEVSKYRMQIEQYENQLSAYKKNCEKLELELFEKDTIEKLYKEQCVKLEEQILEKNTLNDSLKLTTDELQKARTKVIEFENQVSELNSLVREKENQILEHDCRLLELKSEKESSTLRLKELKEKTELEIADKVKTIEELGSLLNMSNDKTRQFEHEIGVLKSLLHTCEEEKRDFRAKIERQVVEYETLKKQHEEKMQHLLAQIISYRTEEETSLAAHRQLVEQIEEAQQKKEMWKRSISDWKEKYDELKKEKEMIEQKLQLCKVHKAENQSIDGATNGGSVTIDNELTKCTVERDWFLREAELRYQLDVATMTTSQVILEWTRLANEKLRLQRELHQRDKPHYVHHLQNTKSQLEMRVRELETANKQLESRLQRLQTDKILLTNFDDFMSGESSRAASPTLKKNSAFEFDYPTYKSGTTTTGYSSSLPSSPNHVKHLPSPMTTSVPGSPMSPKENGCQIPSLWLDTENACGAPRKSAFAVEKQLKITPPRNNSSENSATSPDLGIDSDHGRNSSFDFDTGKRDNQIKNEILKLEEENKTLKLELGQTRKELEETLDKLTMLNKNKRKMEKAIFRQVFETKHILQRAREHLEDGVTEANTNCNS